jgi:Sec-independent protein translocase protein TatA
MKISKHVLHERPLFPLIVFVPKKLPWLAKNIGKVTEEPKKTTEEVESIKI